MNKLAVWKQKIITRIPTRVWIILPFVLLGIGYFLFHSTLTPDWGDDLYYGAALQNTDVFSWMVNRYYNWTCRFLPEAFLVLILHYKIYWLWWLVDSLMLVGIAAAGMRLFGPLTPRTSVLACVIVALFPLAAISNAGWATTTIIYLLPMGGMFLALLPLRLEPKRKDTLPVYILCCLCAVLSASLEQTAVILIGMLLIGFFITRGATRKYCVAAVLCSLAMFLFQYTSPGSQGRQAAEIPGCFPDYLTIPLAEKIEMGLSNTLMYVFMYPGRFFLTAFFILLAYTCFRNTSGPLRYAGFLPLVVQVLYSYVGYRIPWLYENVVLPVWWQVHGQPTPWELSGRYGSVVMETASEPSAYLLLISLLICAMLSITAIYCALGHNVYSLLAIGALAMGFMSRMAMIFATSFWATGERSFGPLYGSLILVAMALCYNLAQQNHAPQKEIITTEAPTSVEQTPA